MTDSTRSPRDARTAALNARGTAARQVARADAALASARQRGASKGKLAELEGARTKALQLLGEARAADLAARQQRDEAKHALASPIERIGELDARVPVVFFPVRLETRFSRRPPNGRSDLAGELLVRIYPDSILAQTHEPLLTDREIAAGQDYWRAFFRGNPEQDSWTALLGEANAARAAWIVACTTPTNSAARPAGGGQPGEPVFAAIEARPAGWHRAPEAPTLPERWIVSAYRAGTPPRQVLSSPVREGLALTLRMSGDADEQGLDDSVDISGDGLKIEPSLRWAYDFAEAEAAGMAVRVGISQEDLDQGFSTVLVAGVRTSVLPAAQATMLQDLFDGHRFSRGLAFVPQGAITNNDTQSSSVYPPADPAGVNSFAVARGNPLATPDTDGYRFMTALGMDPIAAAHVAGAERDEQAAARAMADALWPATMGYFLSQLMAPHASDETIQALRAHLRDHVRGRGPYPAFRVGSVPYGLLPVSTLHDWVPDQRAKDDPIAAQLPGWAERLAKLWSGASPPRVGRSNDPDRDLVEALAQDASAQTVRIRRALGEDTTWNLMGFFGLEFGAWGSVQQRIAAQLLQAMGDLAWDPRVLHLTFADTAPDFSGPLVQSQPLSETRPLVFNYVSWLLTATLDDLKNQLAPPTTEPLNALLYLMLRHALLAEYDRSALNVLIGRELAGPAERLEPELVGILPLAARVAPTAGGAALDASTAVRGTAWDRLATVVAGVTGERGLGAWLADPGSVNRTSLPLARTALQSMADYRGSLAALEGLPSKELERLFTETLDVCSHRVDAWITSIYTQRLEQMRTAMPQGLWTGCYGWVTDLKADPEPVWAKVKVGRTEQEARIDAGGHVYAPSMMHGATAAVLRSAHLTRSASGSAGDTYAVDLSSRRTRLALDLLDSVRDDQPIGAALGYQFERGLHEGHPGAQLDKFIDAFRAQYPLVANKAADSGQAAESVAARNVVDGLRLREAWRAGTGAGAIPWNNAEFAATSAERAALEAELTRLDEAVDAVSDLLLAESVHQVLKGSAAGAGATLDSLSKGKRAPEPEVVSTPRGGGALHQRVALVVSKTLLAQSWSDLGLTPRAEAAPELNAWLGGLLGPPDAIAAVVTVDGQAPLRVTVADLALQPIDLLAYATAAAAGAAGEDLDRRLVWSALQTAGADAGAAIDYADDAGAGWSLADAFELLSECARGIGKARPLEPRDLLAPELESRLAEADSMTANLTGRATAAVTALTNARAAVDQALTAIAAAPAGQDPSLTALRNALRDAATLGVSGAFPGTRFDDSANARKPMQLVGARVRKALDDRIAAAGAAGTTSDKLKAAFGRAFPVLPLFRPAGQDLLAPALATEPSLGPQPDDAVEGWLAGVVRVREALDPWRQLGLYARALDRAFARPRILQLPFEADPAPPRWAALAPDGGPAPRSGLVSIALLGNPPGANEAWCGFLLDAWPEILPNVEEDAGVVFHYDAPGAQAPQCVLVAVPPAPTKTWSWATLEKILLDTLDMARVRTADLEDLGGLGQVIPLAYLAANPANAAIATEMTGLRRAAPIIVNTLRPA